MNPMSAAIKNRRMDSAKPMMDAGPEGEQKPGAPLEQIVASLGDDEKAKLMELLAKDMSADESAEGADADDAGLEDQQGQLKSTPGEQAELSASPEQGQQIMSEMGEPDGSNSFADKIRMNAKKLFGKGK